MVVRLHPGQSRRLSTCLDKEEGAVVERDSSVTRRTWLEVENENTSQSVCGLEISFQSAPQAIDIRLLNSEGDAIAESQDCGVGGPTGATTAQSTITDASIQGAEAISMDLNKTRQ